MFRKILVVVTLLLLILVVAVALSGCTQEPITEKVYLIDMLNETSKPIVWCLVEGNVEPSSYSELKNGGQTSTKVESGKTYTLYCYLNLGESLKCENGSAVLAKSLSTRTQITIETDSIRNVVRLGSDGNSVTFRIEKH